jgi:hypothetical protein
VTAERWVPTWPRQCPSEHLCGQRISEEMKKS